MKMKEYPKIQTVFKRDPATKMKTLLEGQYTLPEFEYLKNNKWVFTEKVDGTNIRVRFRDGWITFAGRTDRAQIPEQLQLRLKERFTFAKMMKLFNTDVCLYGEGYGPKIQNGGKYRKDQDFVLFDVRVGDWWLERTDVEDVADKLGLDVVPIIGEGTLDDMVMLAQGGFGSQWGDFKAEGIVARPEIELYARNGKRIITKIKYRDFKHGEIISNGY